MSSISLNVDSSADAVNEQHFAAIGHSSTADVFIVGRDCVRHFLKGQSVLKQSLRVETNLILLFVAAPAIDFRKRRAPIAIEA
jgi:hypothetical protein